MRNNPPTETENLCQSTRANSTNLTQGSNSSVSPQAFFQTQKVLNKSQNQKHQNKLFETTNQQEIKNNKNVQKKQKENYLDLLIVSLDNQIKSGLVTLDYINSITYPKFSEMSEEDAFSRKCDNPICAVVVDNPSQIFHVKFAHPSSYKNESKWLCEQCYLAFQKQNYCFYCNVVYRDFSFNQQYYDRKKWILCESCERWQHMQCEEKKGRFKNLEELVLDKNFKYICPFCYKDDDGHHGKRALKTKKLLKNKTSRGGIFSNGRKKIKNK